MTCGVKVIVLTSVVYDNQPCRVRLKNRFQLFESYGKVGFVWHPDILRMMDDDDN